MLVSASGGASASLGYDPALRLYQVTAGANTTRFAYDGLDQIAEYDGSNALLRRHVHGPGIDDPIVWYEGSGTTDRRFLSSDERGSIVSVTDGTGALLAINSYDEYGIPGTANAGRFQYTGQAWLPELGFQYSKARIYSPTWGRFLQTDPIDVAGGINLYAYVRNDPINWIDPLGFVRTVVAVQICRPAIITVIQDPGAGASGPACYTNYYVFDSGSGSGSAPRLTGVNVALAHRPKPKGLPDYCFSATYQFGDIAETFGNVVTGTGFAVTPFAPQYGASIMRVGSGASLFGKGMKGYAGSKRDRVGAATAFASAALISLAPAPAGLEGFAAMTAEGLGFAGEKVAESVTGKDPCAY